MAGKGHRLFPNLRATFVSHGYGYGGDLMYFGEIFRALRDRVPHLKILVDRETQFANPYNLDLEPAMSLISRPLERRGQGGQAYSTEVRIARPGLLARLMRVRTDVFVTVEFTAPALMATLVASLRRKTGLVLLIESDPAARGGSTNRAVLAVKRWSVKRANVIQTSNEAGRRYLVDQLKADPRRVRVAPYLTSRPPGPEPRIEPHDGPVRILFANTIDGRKGLRELLEALALVAPATREKLALTVIGEGPERADLEMRAADLGMGQRMRFLGRKSYGDMGETFADADVLAIPSRADYRSLAGFEGLSYGLALLASVHDGATVETLEEGVNGFAIDPRDPARIAQALETLANDRQRLSRMRAASLERYHARFSIERIADDLALSIQRAAEAAH